jgi:large subunit ribosomal protein L17
MRHHKLDKKFGRTKEHRKRLLQSLVSNVILRKRIVTTLEKAKATRRLAERMVQLGKTNSLTARRLIISRLGGNADAAKHLIETIVPKCQDRTGGYLRIVKLGKYRRGDSAEQVVLEWITVPPPQKPPKKQNKEEVSTPSGSPQNQEEKK